jgi:hypothetical protein
MRAVTRADVEALAADMRFLDRQELEASHGGDLVVAVQHAVDVSTACWAMLVDGELAMLGGVAPLSLVGGVGSPWMLGTTLLDRSPGALTRIGVVYLRIVLGLYPELVNYVDARNVKSIRWLRRLGFQIAAEPIPYGPKKLPFYRFDMRI